jgi:hypothetical protein
LDWIFLRKTKLNGWSLWILIKKYSLKLLENLKEAIIECKNNARLCLLRTSFLILTLLNRSTSFLNIPPPFTDNVARIFLTNKMVWYRCYNIVSRGRDTRL